MKNGPYILVVPPEDYPGKKYRGRYAYEHHVVWWENTGEVICCEFVVHHLNGDKVDNRFENLQKLTRAEHDKIPSCAAEKFLMVCCHCGEEFWRVARKIRACKKNKQKRFYCCRSCQVSDQQKRRWKKKRDAMG